MPLIARIKNFVRARKQLWAPAEVKKALWDEEYFTGRWDHCENTRDDPVYPVLATYSAHGSILDLGCGQGNTGSELPAESYSNYTGVDVSEVAIQRARARAQASGRADKNSYSQADILAYTPSQKYDVILFRESLYYLPSGKIVPLLQRLSAALKPRGVFIATFYSAKNSRKVIQQLENYLDVVENISTPSGAVILVLRSAA
jgi:2-polyprenyl-3-methyl-5-hydroxy-6-metoxy-1,4-benzoquinol methylase